MFSSDAKAEPGCTRQAWSTEIIAAGGTIVVSARDVLYTPLGGRVVASRYALSCRAYASPMILQKRNHESD